MADTSADEFSQFPVESVARFLSVCGNEDPNLLRRSRASTVTETRASVPARRQVARNATQHESYIEELVSIAIASARQAEDAARQVHAASASGRRRMFTLSALGAVVLMAGVATIAGGGFGHVHPWEHAGANSAKVAERGADTPMQTAAAVTPVPPAAPAKEVVEAPAKEAVDVRVADAFAPNPATMSEPVLQPPAPSMENETPPAGTAEPLPVDATRQEEAPVAQPDPAEAALHANATAQAAERAVARPSVPAPVAVASAAPPARGHSPDRALTLPSQLVAAVEALESLTNERPSRRSRQDERQQDNNRM